MSQPVIIVGAARSGTKYLRDVLATASNAAKVPYDVSYIWRYGSEDYPHDALPASLASEKKSRFIHAQIHRLAKADPASGTVVFEKTVGNTLRVPFVDDVLPDAKFVHLVRDGRAVTESAMRQWSEPMDWRRLIEKVRGLPLQNIGYAVWFAGNFMKGLYSGRGGGRVWGPRYPGIDADVESGRDLAEICAEQWRACVSSATEALEAIPADRRITIRYDELVGGTEALESVARFCELDGINCVLSAHRERVDTRTDDKWRTALSADQQARIAPILNSELARLGYISKDQAA